MAGPLFFLSYARSNANALLDQFLQNLVDEVDQRTRRPSAGQGNLDSPAQRLRFQDTKNILLGENWDSKLQEALRTCKAFVPLYSPHFFDREFCGKEWSAFVSRLPGGNQTSPLILPVLWRPVDLKKYNLPKAVTDIQYEQGDL